LHHRVLPHPVEPVAAAEGVVEEVVVDEEDEAVVVVVVVVDSPLRKEKFSSLPIRKKEAAAVEEPRLPPLRL
jgi:hypothetical protein